MARLLSMDYSTKWALFSIESAAELEQLPTTTSTGSLPNFDDTITPMSIAVVSDGSYTTYCLDESDNWNAET